MKKTAVFCSLCVACALIACAAILVKPSVVFRNAGGIKVKGTAVERVESDAMRWSASIQVNAPTIEQAVADIDKIAQTAKAEFKSAGAEKAEFSPVDVYPIYIKDKNGCNTNRIESYNASLTVSAQPKSRKQIAPFDAAAAALLKKGVPIFDARTVYFYSKLEDMKMRLLEKASKNARERAEKLVLGSGAQLGPVLSASQGIFQITAPLSTETSDWGVYDTSSYEKEIKCVVTIEFSTK